MEAKGNRLVRRDNGFWYIVCTGNSRGRSTGTRDRAAAEKAFAAFILEDDIIEHVRTGLTVHQALEDYLAEHIRPHAANKEIAEIAAEYFMAHFSPDALVADVRDEDIDFPADPRKPLSGNGYIQKRREGRIVLKKQDPVPAADGTLRREIGFLSSAFEHAGRKQHEDGTPRIAKAAIPFLPRPAQPPPRDRWLTVEEEARLIAACSVDEADESRRRSANIRQALRSSDFIGPPAPPPHTPERPRLTRIYRFLMLALETAARKEALETLTWFQVNFATGTIDLNPPGRRQTNKRRAIVRMSARLRAVLERAFEEKTTDFVLDNETDVRTSFDNLVKRSGLKDVTPHVLRHTWATRAAQAGVPMREIADWLGDNIATVERNYYKRSPHYLKDAVDWREREQQLRNG